MWPFAHTGCLTQWSSFFFPCPVHLTSTAPRLCGLCRAPENFEVGFHWSQKFHRLELMRVKIPKAKHSKCKAGPWRSIGCFPLHTKADQQIADGFLDTSASLLFKSQVVTPHGRYRQFQMTQTLSSVCRRPLQVFQLPSLHHFPSHDGRGISEFLLLSCLRGG